MEKSVIVKSKVPPALIGKGPASSTVAWTIYQKYANGMPLYRQERTGRNTALLSAGRPWRTGSSTVLSIISGHCMITFTASFC